MSHGDPISTWARVAHNRRPARSLGDATSGAGPGAAACSPGGGQRRRTAGESEERPHDHVRFAYGIVTAYAVLEQLGLTLHNKAFRHGEWILEKRSELEERLKKAGADLTDLAVWYLRGGKTRIERSRRTQAVKKAEWAWGPVRDVEVEVVDAIADLRWMRSRVAAHDIKELAAQISVYDVANAQYLARRCILACLGFER